MMNQQPVQTTVGRTSGDLSLSLMSYQASMFDDLKKYGNEVLNRVSYDRGYQVGYGEAWHKASDQLRQEMITFQNTMLRQQQQLKWLVWTTIVLSGLGGLSVLNIL